VQLGPGIVLSVEKLDNRGLFHVRLTPCSYVMVNSAILPRHPSLETRFTRIGDPEICVPKPCRWKKPKKLHAASGISQDSANI